MFYTLHIEVFTGSIKTSAVQHFTYPREIKGAKAAKAKADQIRFAIADVCKCKCVIIRRDRNQRGKWLSA